MLASTVKKCCRGCYHYHTHHHYHHKPVVVHGQVGGLQDLVLGQRLVLQLPIEGVVLHVQLLNQGGHWSLTDQAVKQTEDNYLSENNNLTDYKPFGDNFVYISISKH